MVIMFIDTLPSPFYDKVVGNVASNFVNLVVVGERIELGIKWGKFTQSSNNIGFTKKPNQEKKGEANAILLESRKASSPIPDLNPCKRARANDSPNNPTTTSGCSLLDEMPPPIPPQYQQKIDNKIEHEPNVNNNPLPVHGRTSINAISHECWEEELEEA
ncbi:hypothetical protein CR513_34297, partial [Mucuna pruriens]